MRNERWFKSTEQIEMSLYMYALSVVYAKKHNLRITCHCDSFIYPYLKVLPYDEIYVDLDDLESKMAGDPVFMWAAGKAVALENEPLGTIHIDGDVFIKGEKCVKELNFDDYDMICSHIEESEYKEQKYLADYIPTVNMDYEFAANVGVIGFNNEEARKNYITHYNYYRDNLVFDTKGDKNASADLILEQLYLYQLSKKYSLKSLIGSQEKDSTIDIQNRCTEMGFEHLIGRVKFTPIIFKMVKKNLEALDKDLFNKLQEFKWEHKECKLISTDPSDYVRKHELIL